MDISSLLGIAVSCAEMLRIKIAFRRSVTSCLEDSGLLIMLLRQRESVVFVSYLNCTML